MVRVHPDADVRAAGQAIEERLNAWRQDLVLRDDIATAIRTYADSTDAASLTGEERRLLDRWLRDLRRAGHGLPDRGAGRDQGDHRTDRRPRVVVRAQSRRVVRRDRPRARTTSSGCPTRTSIGSVPGPRPGRSGSASTTRTTTRSWRASPRRDLRQILATKMANRVVATQSADPRGDAGPAPPEGAAARLSILGALPDRAEDGGDPGARGGASTTRSSRRSRRSRRRNTRRCAVTCSATRARPTSRRGTSPTTTSGSATEEYGVDPDEVSAYLPLVATIDGLLELTGDVFGLDYVRVAESMAWDPDVPLLRGPRPGERRATRLVLPRPPPAAGQVRSRDGVAGPAGPRGRGRPRGSAGSRRSSRTSRAASGDDPGLLRHDDMVMLYHEFGHVLHEVLGTNRYLPPVDVGRRARLPRGDLADHGELGLVAGHPRPRHPPPP